MSTPFKMKGMSFKNSPVKQDKKEKVTSRKKDTKTASQKAAEKRDLDRQIRIYDAQEKSRKYHAKREQKELKEKGYYIDATDGKKYEHAEEMRGTGKNRKMTKFVREKRDQLKSVYNFVVTPVKSRYNNTKDIGGKELIVTKSPPTHERTLSLIDFNL